MKKGIIVLVVLAAVGYGLLSYHIILLDDTIRFLRKSQLHYQHTFVDARGAKKLQLVTKPDLVDAGIRDIFRKLEKAADHPTE